MTGDQEQGTEPGARPEALVWKPRGHPVRWAAGVVVAIAVACVVSIWFGAVTPRVGTQPATIDSEAADTTDDRVVSIAFEVTNRAASRRPRSPSRRGHHSASDPGCRPVGRRW